MNFSSAKCSLALAQDLVGKISFTTSYLRRLLNGAHTWGLSLLATPNLADEIQPPAEADAR
jgi:hypothetical protein